MSGLLGSSILIARGDVAHDAADSGNPIKVGGKARSSAPSDVANGDRVDAYFDQKGRLVMYDDQNATTLSSILTLGQAVRTEAGAGEIDADPKTLDGIVFDNLHSGKYGSSDGATYGAPSAKSFILIPLAVANYSRIWMSFHLVTAFDQNVTLAIFEHSGNNTTIPATAQVLGGKLASITIPASTNNMYFSFSDGIVDATGTEGGASAAVGAMYRIAPGSMCPYVYVDLLSAGTITTGAFTKITICRGP